MDRNRSRLDIRLVSLCLQLFLQLFKGVGSRIYRFVCRIDQLVGLVFPSMAFCWFDRGTSVAVGVEVFVYSFAPLSSPDFVFTKSEEHISSSVGWVIFIDFLNSAIGLRKAETT